jgi:hypothetical protein
VTTNRFNPSAILIVLNRTYDVNQSIAQEISKMLPWWAVSTADHMMHHRVQASHFARLNLNKFPQVSN